MILCDTNILIEFFKDNETVKNELRQIGFAELAVSIITTAELFYGARDKTELQTIQKRLAAFKQVELDPEIFLGLLR
jgi:tRNA(fMet)-specific endonuclease VapC